MTSVQSQDIKKSNSKGNSNTIIILYYLSNKVKHFHKNAFGTYPSKYISKTAYQSMTFSGPPPPPPNQGTWVQNAQSRSVPPADPTVPRSTPVNEPPLAEQQYGRDDYARASCSKGACDVSKSGHDYSYSEGGSSENYTFSQKS